MIKIERKYWLIFGGVFLLYLGTRYWDSLMNVLQTIFHASMPLLVGCLFAYIVNLPLRVIENKLENIIQSQKMLKYKRVFSIVLSYLSIFLIIALVMRVVVPELISCVKLLVNGHTKSLAHITNLIQQSPQLEKYAHIANEAINGGKGTGSGFDISKVTNILMYGFGGTLKSVYSAANSAFSIGANILIGLAFSVYLLASKDHLKYQGYLLLDTYFYKISDKVMYVLRVFDESYSGYIVGQCKDALVLGGMTFLTMTVFRMPYAGMIAAVISFTALIPIIGAILGATVGAVIIFTVSPFKVLMFIILIVVLQQVDNRITYPLIVGKNIGLPSVWVFAAVMIGGGVWGIFGMMFTVPLFSALYRLLKSDVYERQEAEINEVDDFI